jgi:hypothetical protein
MVAPNQLSYPLKERRISHIVAMHTMHAMVLAECPRIFVTKISSGA